MLKQELSFDDKTIKTEDLLVACSTSIGTREYQQDYALVPSFAAIESGRYLCVLCDGMGGMDQGELASKTAAEYLEKEFSAADSDIDYFDFLMTKITEANELIVHLEDEDGNTVETGSTMIAIVVDGDRLYWASVGDSRIYLFRNEHLSQLTTDQNYGAILLNQLAQGQITIEEANADPLKDALTSYIGMEKDPEINISQEAFRLQDGDIILMCSDGLYRTLEDEETSRVLSEYKNNIPLAAYMLIQAVTEKEYKNQDNTTVILAKYSDKNSSKENEKNGYEEM